MQAFNNNRNTLQGTQASSVSNIVCVEMLLAAAYHRSDTLRGPMLDMRHMVPCTACGCWTGPPCQCTQAHLLPVGTVGGRMAGTWNPACSKVSLRPNAAASLTTPSTNHQITLLQHNTPRHAPMQQASAQHSIAYAYTPGPLLQPLILPAGTVGGQMAGTWNPASSRVLLRPKAAASLPSTRRMTGLTTGTPFPPSC